MSCNKEQAENLWTDILSVLSQYGADYEEYEGYSGRCMYGRKSAVAFTVDRWDYAAVADDLRSLGLSSDNLGMDYIFYTTWGL